MVANNCKQCEPARLNFQSIQTAHSATTATKRKPNQKMGRTCKIFLQRNTYGQEAHEEMLNITNYQRNATQNPQ